MKKTLALTISFFLKLFYKLRYGQKVSFGKGIIINHKFKFSGKGRLLIGNNCNLWAHHEPNTFQTFSQNAVISIGENNRLNGTTIQCKTAITIGNDCLIGSCMLIDQDFHSIHATKRNNPEFIKSAPITIGNKVWLAGQSAILKGVTVGDEAVVAFRAVVTKNVPPKTVAAGNPAQVVKEIL